MKYIQVLVAPKLKISLAKEILQAAYHKRTNLKSIFKYPHSIKKMKNLNLKKNNKMVKNHVKHST